MNSLCVNRNTYCIQINKSSSHTQDKSLSVSDWAKYLEPHADTGREKFEHLQVCRLPPSVSLRQRHAHTAADCVEGQHTGSTDATLAQLHYRNGRGAFTENNPQLLKKKHEEKKGVGGCEYCWWAKGEERQHDRACLINTYLFWQSYKEWIIYTN